MLPAITTKYFGPTDHQGSRIKATYHNGQSITVGYQSELNFAENHRRAALKLIAKTKTACSGDLIGGYSRLYYVWLIK